MRPLLPERQTPHLGVAGLGGDGAMLVAIAAARYRPLAQRGVAQWAVSGTEPVARPGLQAALRLPAIALVSSDPEIGRETSAGAL